MRRGEALAAHEEMEIAERGWLVCGLLWVVIGALALGPFGPVAEVGRVLFGLVLLVHVLEAFYAAFRAHSAGLSAPIWLLRTIVLGAFALLTLEAHLRKVPRGRLAR